MSFIQSTRRPPFLTPSVYAKVSTYTLADSNKYSQPDSISQSGLLLWLKPEGLLDVRDGLVNTWLDASSNFNHASGTSTARPAIVSSALNGYTSVDFSNTISTVIFRRITTARTVFWLTKHNTGTTATYSTMFGDGENHNVWHGNNNGSTLFSTSFASANVYNGSAWVDGTSTLATALQHYATWRVVSLNTLSDMPLDRLAKDRGSSSWNAQFLEVICYDRVLTTQERIDVEVYLARKYNTVHPLR